MRLPYKFLYLLGLLLLEYLSLSAQNYGKKPADIADWAYPNPATAITIFWSTDTTIHEGYVEMKPVDDITQLLRRKVKSDDIHAKPEKNAILWWMKLEDLEPTTKYTYRVGTDSYWSEWRSFETGSLAQLFPASPVPDRITLTWKGDPATSMAVTWRTDSTVTNSVAEIAVATATPTSHNEDPKWEMPNASQMAAVIERMTIGDVTTHHHSAHFMGLRPKTSYAYRVGNGKIWSEWFHFTTASDQPEKFSFIYFGDAQVNIKSMWSRTIRQAYSHLPTAAFMVHAGDLIGGDNKTGGQEWDWGEWFHAGGFIHAMVPSIPVTGNTQHYIESLPGSRYGFKATLQKNWRPLFTLPENGPDTGEEDDYYIDYQGTRLIALNSTRFLYDLPHRKRQLTWLREVLSDNPNRWTLVTTHHPMGVEKLDGKNEKGEHLRGDALLKELKPVFDEFRVDLVMQGHIHQYVRGQQWDNKLVKRDDNSGTMYVVSVSGPGMLDTLGELSGKEIIRKGQGLQLYQIVEVDGDRLSFGAYTTTGELYDAFELIKQGNGKPNKVVNSIPPIPEQQLGVEQEASN